MVWQSFHCLNLTCSIAEKILCHVDATIGMTDSISDVAARVFAAQLYSGIGFDLDLQTAINQARIAIALVSLNDIEETPRIGIRLRLCAEIIVFLSPSPS